MEYEVQLKIQAYLDGELPEKEARDIANLLARDREAVALHGELRNTRQAMAGFEVGTELPESREFFWSKIEREIQRLRPTEAAPAGASRSVFAAWRRFLMPAGAIAVLAIAVLVANRQVISEAGGLASAKLETSRSDPGAFTYRDYAGGATLVWLSYPAEDEAGQDQASDSTIQ